MTPYDAFAQFYDAVNGEPEELVTQLLDALARFAPDARSLLELGCGTGAVLAGLGSGLELTGLDMSERMLAHARRRCPDARLLVGDITSFDLADTFDVVVCVFDTLNHVTTPAGWRSVFANAAAHLREGGVFLFDLNTVGRLRDLGDAAPWVYDFDGHTLVMNVDFLDDPLAVWDIRIFERLGDATFRLHHESIVELAVELEHVRTMLSPYFDVLEESDTQGSRPTDDSERAFIVARRLPDAPVRVPVP
ncbi:MAG: methyltransferase domain-containing protein [Acidobacteria bacterium]|nr:methyltransferase domain-containing protein [Acidobacteriota bacterium]